jgi:hypothetical protein
MEFGKIKEGSLCFVVTHHPEADKLPEPLSKGEDTCRRKISC